MNDENMTAETVETKPNSGAEEKPDKAKKVSGETGGRTKKKKSALAFAIEFFIKIAVTALVVFLLLHFVVGVYVNHSNSSYPMIKDGDLCITYRMAKFIPQDEIAYLHGDKIRFGRIVAMPGDVVDTREGNILVNGLNVFENSVYPTTDEGATIEFPYTVPADSYFVLNDYRSEPTDSRMYGAIPKAETKGKIFLMLRRRGF